MLLERVSKSGWRYQVWKNCLNWPWITAGAGKFRSHNWGTACNMGSCCILQGDLANALVPGSTSVFAGVSVPRSPISTVKSACPKAFSYFYFSLHLPPLPLGWAMRPWPWFPFGLEMLMLLFLIQGKAFPLERKGQKIPLCVLAGHTLCFERKAISCQNPVRRGVLKMVWYFKGSPCKRQSPGSIFCLIFSSGLWEGQGVICYHRGDFPWWFATLLQANLL